MKSIEDGEIEHISDDDETVYLLKSETMKRRLLDAKNRDEGIAFQAALEKLLS